jgi:hypothetical protein
MNSSALKRASLSLLLLCATTHVEAARAQTATPPPPPRCKTRPEYRQFWEKSADGGKTWTVAFDGTYSKKK